jgi:hypothetical protein
MRITASLGVTAAAAMAISGCGSVHLTHKSIEKAFASQLGSAGYPGVSVKCPDVNDKVGTTFTCKVSGSSKVHSISGIVSTKDHVKISKVG